MQRRTLHYSFVLVVALTAFSVSHLQAQSVLLTRQFVFEGIGST